MRGQKGAAGPLGTCRMSSRQGAEDIDIPTLPPTPQLPQCSHNSRTHGMPHCSEHLLHPTSATLTCSPSLPFPGRKSPQAEHGGEGAAAAKPASRGVERGGRQRRHLQRVPLQGLQPGTSARGTESDTLGHLVCRAGSPLCKAQPKKALCGPPEMEWLNKVTYSRHQSARPSIEFVWENTPQEEENPLKTYIISQALHLVGLCRHRLCKITCNGVKNSILQN